MVNTNKAHTVNVENNPLEVLVGSQPQKLRITTDVFNHRGEFLRLDVVLVDLGRRAKECPNLPPIKGRTEAKRDSVNNDALCAAGLPVVGEIGLDQCPCNQRSCRRAIFSQKYLEYVKKNHSRAGRMARNVLILSAMLSLLRGRLSKSFMAKRRRYEQ